MLKSNIVCKINDNKFTIIRTEDFGNVKHYVNFDKKYLTLIEKIYNPNKRESSVCTTLYTFEIKLDKIIDLYSDLNFFQLEINFNSDYNNNYCTNDNYCIDLKNQIVTKIPKTHTKKKYNYCIIL